MKLSPPRTVRWERQSRISWDGDARAGYVDICPDPEVDPEAMCCHRHGGTVELADGVNLDYEQDGSVIGVEVLGREAGMGDLILALRWVNQVVRNGRSQERQPVTIHGVTQSMTRLKAAIHEIRCAECRVTWRSWLARVLHLGGMSPKVRNGNGRPSKRGTDEQRWG